MTDLVKQVVAEQKQLEDAPKTPVKLLHPSRPGRCSFCGQMADHLEPVDTMHGMERFRGECCGGTTH